MSEQDANNRTETRSNVFLAARLGAGKASVPVRIRNISSRGALIDGAQIPPVGSIVCLSRGSLAARGEIAWQVKHQAGVTFNESVDVDRWVQRVGHLAQRRVDQVVDAFRRSESPPRQPRSDTSELSLGVISAELDRICERLSDTPYMTLELGQELLSLDVIAQSLRRFATRE